MKKIILFVLLGFLLLSIACGSSGSLPSSSITQDIEISSKKGEKLPSIGALLITGEVVNNSTTVTYKYVKIRAYVYDSDGNEIGTEYSYLSSDQLAPGATSTFSIYVDCNVSKADKYKVIIVDD